MRQFCACVAITGCADNGPPPQLFKQSCSWNKALLILCIVTHASVCYSGDEARSNPCKGLLVGDMAFGSRIREFDLSENSSWVDYVERIELSCAANKLTTDDDKRAVLLSCCGPETYSLIATLVKPSRPPNVGYQVIVDAVKKHINPKPSELYSSTLRRTPRPGNLQPKSCWAGSSGPPYPAFARMRVTQAAFGSRHHEVSSLVTPCTRGTSGQGPSGCLHACRDR
ncbi:uncharacterized protein LOC144122839 [Amblyomma americanum]